MMKKEKENEGEGKCGDIRLRIRQERSGMKIGLENKK